MTFSEFKNIYFNLSEEDKRIYTCDDIKYKKEKLL